MLDRSIFRIGTGYLYGASNNRRHATLMNFSGYQQKRRRGSGEISNLEEPVSKVPCRASQQNLLGSAGFINEDYLATHCPKASTMISEKCLHEQHVPEEQNIEKLKVKRGKRLRLPSWQRRKRRKGLILQGSCSQDPSSKVLDNEDVINETCQHVVGNIKCHSLVVPTSDTNSDNQEGAGLRSKQLVTEATCVLLFLDFEYLFMHSNL